MAQINIVNIALLVWGSIALPINTIVHDSKRIKDGYAAYSVDLAAGWRPMTDAEATYFTRPDGTKLRVDDFIDKQGDTLHIDCVNKPSRSLMQSAKFLREQKPAKTSMVKIIPQQIGKYQSGLIIIRWPKTTKTTVAADLVDASVYISVQGSYVHYPTPSQLAGFEKMAASVRVSPH